MVCRYLFKTWKSKVRSFTFTPPFATAGAASFWSSNRPRRRSPHLTTHHSPLRCGNENNPMPATCKTRSYGCGGCPQCFEAPSAPSTPPECPAGEEGWVVDSRAEEPADCAKWCGDGDKVLPLACPWPACSGCVDCATMPSPPPSPPSPPPCAAWREGGPRHFLGEAACAAIGAGAECASSYARASDGDGYGPCAWAGSECYNRADEPCAPSPGCVCTNACVGAPGWAADGWCDDGGPGFSTRACELGTDCDDCGDSCRARAPRMEASPAPEDAFVGPEEEVVIVQ